MPTFNRIPSAHALLNGAIKSFWTLVSRDKKTKLPVGDHLRVTSAQAKEMAARAAQMSGTSAHDSQLPDILQCASCLAAAEQFAAWQTNGMSGISRPGISVLSRYTALTVQIL